MTDLMTNTNNPLPEDWAAEVDALRQDYTHGASWIARQACALLMKHADERYTGSKPRSRAREHFTALAFLAWELAWMRPSMAAIASAVAQVWPRAAARPSQERIPEQASDSPFATRATQLHEAASAVIAETVVTAALDAIAAYVKPLLHDPIFTLSRSATVERALVASARARPANAPLRVIIAESTPGGEGRALATALRAAGAIVTVVADSSVGVALRDSRTLVFGADSVRAEGHVVNKAGSYLAALAANDLGIPVYTLFERLKVAPVSYPLVLERAPRRGARTAVSSWLFDETPAKLISGFITENGELTLPEIARFAAEADAGLADLKGFLDQARMSPASH